MIALGTLNTMLHRLGPVKNSAESKCVEVLQAVSATGFTPRYVWGYDSNVGNTEHHSGLSIDFMVFGNKAAGDWIYSYLWANRTRLRVRHIIWYQSITSTVVSPGLRRAMSDRGNGTANHLDHVHVLFLDDAAYVPPGARPPVTPPVTPSSQHVPTKSIPTLRVGSKGSQVRALQRGLNSHFPAYSRLTVDGDYGAKTAASVHEFQRRVGISADGVVGPVTRQYLRKYGINV